MKYSFLELLKEFFPYAKFFNNLSIKPVLIISLNRSGVNQPAVTCSNLTIETLEQSVKYVQS